MSEEIVWKDRKRTLFGLPWSFTRYTLTETKLLIDTGFFSRNEEEIRLYRILDVTLTRTLGQRIFGLGTIHCNSADKTTPVFDIIRVKKSKDVKNLLSDLVEEERSRRRVGMREFVGGDDDADGDGIDDDDDIDDNN